MNMYGIRPDYITERCFKHRKMTLNRNMTEGEMTSHDMVKLATGKGQYGDAW